LREIKVSFFSIGDADFMELAPPDRPPGDERLIIARPEDLSYVGAFDRRRNQLRCPSPKWEVKQLITTPLCQSASGSEFSHTGDDELPFTERLVVAVRLTGTGQREIRLQLDSGSDGPILYTDNSGLEQSLLTRAKLQGPEVGDARSAFAVLPLQDMNLGSRIVRNVPFVTPVNRSQKVADREADGILPTVLFKRVFVSYSDRFVIFDPM